MNSESLRQVLISLIKVVLVLLGIIFLFLIGISIGYAVIGDGKMQDVFNGQIWDHIFSFLR